MVSKTSRTGGGLRSRPRATQQAVSFLCSSNSNVFSYIQSVCLDGGVGVWEGNIMLLVRVTVVIPGEAQRPQGQEAWGRGVVMWHGEVAVERAEDEQMSLEGADDEERKLDWR